MKDELKATLYCSFCGKSQHEVGKLIVGPTVFICNECVGLCVDMLIKEGISPGRGAYLVGLSAEQAKSLAEEGVTAISFLQSGYGGVPSPATGVPQMFEAIAMALAKRFGTYPEHVRRELQLNNEIAYARKRVAEADEQLQALLAEVEKLKGAETASILTPKVEQSSA